MRLLTAGDLRALITPQQALEAVRECFVALALGRATVPAPIEVDFPHQHADLHVKGGFVDGLPYFAFKVVSGFYDNRERGLPVTSGVSLLFDSQTGAIVALLFDDGFLTELRTGAAGALAADLLALPQIETAGIIGTGSQARYQLEALMLVRQPRRVLVYGRNRGRALAYAAEMTRVHGVAVEVSATAEDLCRAAQLIVTATTARAALVLGAWLAPGTHITAVGSDVPEKQELAPDVLERADVVVADRLEQCRRSGEIHHALAAGAIGADGVVELGPLTAGLVSGRRSDGDITVADLTGVGVQDIAVANVIGRRLDELGGAAPGWTLELAHLT
jgi:ornithine cyclodeaminase/alanine dehydrogenase-like protein (mu-crystallin family)